MICVFDAQFGIAANYLGAGSPFLTVNKGTYNNGNIGDDTPGVVRLRRVWDSWSTEYSQAPGTGSITPRVFWWVRRIRRRFIRRIRRPTRRPCGEFRSRSAWRIPRINASSR